MTSSTITADLFEAPVCRPALVPVHRWWIVAALSTLALGIIPAILWPGAVSWMCDEPMLVGQACYYNQAHQLASRGLGGTMGIAYGPLPTQFYQLCLLFTHDVRNIVFVHALCLTSLMAGSLLWLSRTLRLTPWFAVAVVLAPYLWWSQRVLWDASFALPIGMLGMAAYAAHLRKRSPITLAVAVTALTLTPLIHLQGLPLFAAFAIHALWHFPKNVRRWKWVPVAITLILILDGVYMFNTVVEVVPRLTTIFHSGYGKKETQTPLWISLTGPFRSGCLFDGTTFENERFQQIGPPILKQSSLRVSQLATPIICGGILVAFVSQFFRRKEESPNENDFGGTSPPDTSIAAVRTSLSRICLGALLMQILLAGSLHVPPFPQYCFGTFPIHVFFGWLFIDFLQRFRVGVPLAILWGISLGIITLIATWQSHAHGWNRWLLSPSLDDQIAVARQLNEYSDTTVTTNISTFTTYPMAIRELRVIMPPEPGKPFRQSPHGLILRYAGPDPSSRIELVESPVELPDNDDGLDDGFDELDVTPMARLY